MLPIYVDYQCWIPRFTTNVDLQVDNVDNVNNIDNVEKVNEVDMPHYFVKLDM